MTKDDQSKSLAAEGVEQKLEHAVEKLEQTEEKLEQVVEKLEQAEAKLEKAEEKAEHAGKPQLFKIQIDKALLETNNPTPTGRDLLILAGKNPPEQYAIYLKAKGGQPQRIGLTDTVDLREPGVERFVTLPLDQTEG
jgi:exonuclease VII small subunit